MVVNGEFLTARSASIDETQQMCFPRLELELGHLRTLRVTWRLIRGKTAVEWHEAIDEIAVNGQEIWWNVINVKEVAEVFSVGVVGLLGIGTCQLDTPPEGNAFIAGA